MGTLYIVPTPIGNLEDVTLRALRVLREVSLIAAEDTRTTRKLLTRYEISTPLTSYHEHNKLSKLEIIFDALAQGDVALVSDAGTPGISDPGFELIQEALARDVTVVPLPGPSAVIAALVGSGLPADRFLFTGFLPRKAAALRDALSELASLRATLIVYESPNRLVATLSAARDILGDRQAVVARELSKVHEELRRGTLSELADHFRDSPPRGEITLVISGAAEQPADETWDEARVRRALAERMAQGEPRSAAARAIAEVSGWNRRDVYNLNLE